MFKKTLLPLALILGSGAANAGTITNDSDLLTASDHAQLSEWLGSDFDLTRIFAKGVDGISPYDWHRKVDGKGATFTVLEVVTDNGPLIIGGYNDQSWESNERLVVSKERNNFLFSLSNGVKYEISDDPSNPNNGYYQGYNRGSVGIYFSGYYGGPDLQILGDKLNVGYSNIGNTYGDYSLRELDSYSEEFIGTNKTYFTVGAYETFTLSSSTVPFASDVPASFLLGGLGLFGFMALRSKKLLN